MKGIMRSLMLVIFMLFQMNPSDGADLHSNTQCRTLLELGKKAVPENELEILRKRENFLSGIWVREQSDSCHVMIITEVSERWVTLYFLHMRSDEARIMHPARRDNKITFIDPINSVGVGQYNISLEKQGSEFVLDVRYERGFATFLTYRLWPAF